LTGLLLKGESGKEEGKEGNEEGKGKGGYGRKGEGRNAPQLKRLYPSVEEGGRGEGK